MKRINIFIVALVGSLLAKIAVAGNLPGLGGVAQNMMDPVGLFSDFVYSGAIIIGISFLFASVIKYKEHRRSPLYVPISTVVFLLITGLLLLLMPFLSYLDSNALPFSFFR